MPDTIQLVSIEETPEDGREGPESELEIVLNPREQRDIVEIGSVISQEPSGVFSGCASCVLTP